MEEFFSRTFQRCTPYSFVWALIFVPKNLVTWILIFRMVFSDDIPTDSDYKIKSSFRLTLELVK